MQGSTDPAAGSGSEPAREFYVVVPADGADLPKTPRGVYVGGAGNVACDDWAGNASIVFTAVPVGTVLPIIPKRIRATGTTVGAGLLIALV